MKDRFAWWLVRAGERLFGGEFTVEVKPFEVEEPKRDYWTELYPDGSMLKSLCPNCSQVVIQKMEGGKSPKVYCSKKCVSIRRERMKKFVQNPRECPTPHKVSYPSGVSAQKHHSSLVKAEPSLITSRAYACICGKYHIGKWKYEIFGEVADV